MKKQHIFFERENKELKTKAQVYHSQITHLRSFVVHLTQDLELHKKKEFRES